MKVSDSDVGVAVNFKKTQFFLNTLYLFTAGSKCIKDPKPDSSHNLAVFWNPKFPPAHNETIQYK